MVQKYFNRFELKFQISLRDRDRIIKQLTPFMELDRHNKNNYDYEVRSTYYDSQYMNSFFEKENGVKTRIKLRIRYYPENQTGDQEDVFIELKKKMNNNVSKSRILVPFNDASEIIESSTEKAQKFYQNANKRDKQSVEEIWYLYKRYHLRPVCVVCYHRQPYMAKIEKTFRITFDTRLKVRNFNYNLHNNIGTKWILPRDMCVMEIKFNSFLPRWAALIMQKNDCLQEKISKFASGLQKMNVFNI